MLTVVLLCKCFVWTLLSKPRDTQVTAVEFIWEVPGVASGWPYWLCICQSNAMIPSPTRRLVSMIAVCWENGVAQVSYGKDTVMWQQTLTDSASLKTNSIWDNIYTDLVADNCQLLRRVRKTWITRGYFTRVSPLSSVAGFILALSNYKSDWTRWRLNPSEWSCSLFNLTCFSLASVLSHL